MSGVWSVLGGDQSTLELFRTSESVVRIDTGRLVVGIEFGGVVLCCVVVNKLGAYCRPGTLSAAFARKTRSFHSHREGLRVVVGHSDSRT